MVLLHTKKMMTKTASNKTCVFLMVNFGCQFDGIDNSHGSTPLGMSVRGFLS